MQTSALDSAQGQSQLLRQLMALARANASQEDSSGTASSTQSTQDAQGGQQGSAAAPPAPGATPADLFSGSTLGALTSAQETAGGWRHQIDADVANQMIGQLDTNGDGQLSLSEIAGALGISDAPGSSSSTGAATNATDGLAAAFAQVDANGDGELSSNELTNALGQMQGHRGHHHHHGGDAQASDGSLTLSDIQNALSALTGALTGAGGSGSTPSGSTSSNTVSTLDGPTASGGASTASSATSSNTVSTLDGLTPTEITQALQAFLNSLAQSQAANLAALQRSANATSVTA